MNNAINIIDCKKWWESSQGENKAGNFNVQLYLDYLTIKNEKEHAKSN